MIVTLAMITGLIFGALIHRAIVDGILHAQEHAHEKEKEWMWYEMRRLRAQNALLIGKE
jgi:hypothetical protein